MPNTVRLRVLTALLTLALAAPLSAYAAEETAAPIASHTLQEVRGSGFATTEQADGTIADELVLALASTLVGIAFVSMVFAVHRKETQR